MSESLVRPQRRRAVIRCSVCREPGHNKRSCPEERALSNKLRKRTREIEDLHSEEVKLIEVDDVDEPLCKCSHGDGDDDDEGGKFECPICLELLNIPNSMSVQSTICGHVFHHICLMKCFYACGFICPTCKTPQKEEAIK